MGTAMTDARLYAATARTKTPLERADSGRRQTAVLTPEGVELRVELAERGERAGAFLIDALFVIGAVLVLVFGTIYLMTLLEGYALAFGLAVFFLLRTFYFSFFELIWRGRTPGKRLIGLRVIDRAGGPLRPSSVVVRNLMREIEVFLPLSLMMVPDVVGNAGLVQLCAAIWIGIFVLMPVFNRQGLRIGDMVAGTLVVASPKAALLPDLVDSAISPIGAVPALRAQPVSGRFAFEPHQLEHYGIYELQTLEAVLRRSDAHAGQTRREIAERIRRKINWTSEADWNFNYDGIVVEFLQSFYVAQRAHLERKMLFGKRRKDKHDKG
jgi:uncharacterized RDD family membrane protein YckC